MVVMMVLVVKMGHFRMFAQTRRADRIHRNHRQAQNGRQHADHDLSHKTSAPHATSVPNHPIRTNASVVHYFKRGPALNIAIPSAQAYRTKISGLSTT